MNLITEDLAHEIVSMLVLKKYGFVLPLHVIQDMVYVKNVMDVI